MDKLIHLSDLHIRDERRPEYELIFDRTLALIKPHAKNALIIITGDIFHNKTKYEPSDIKGASDFLRALRRLAPVIIIPGAHDIGRKNKMDLITPLLETGRDLDTIIYHKSSGAYPYKNINFTVLSVADEIEIHRNVLSTWRDTTRTNILLCHNAVQGTTINYNESCQVLDAPRISLNTIDSFDLVLSGYGHDYQEFGTAGRGAYAGALYRQDINESPTKGFIIWDLPAKTKQFIPVPNDWGFINCLPSGDSELTIQEPAPHPANIYKAVIRCPPQSPEPDLKTIKKSLESTYSMNIKKIISLPLDRELSSTQHDSPAAGEPSSTVAPIIEYIKKYFSNKEEKIINSVLEFHAKQEARLGRPLSGLELSRKERGNNSWKLLKLSWSDVYCYGNNNSLNLSALPRHVIAGIIADNRSGKTSVIDAIIYVLYNKVVRGHVADVVRHGMKSGLIEITLKLHDDEIRIRRICAATGYVDIWINGALQPRRDITETYKYLAEKIGTLDDLQRTCLITQEDRTKNDFVWATKKDRYITLGAFFQLNDLIKLGEDVKADRDAAIKELAIKIGLATPRIVGPKVIGEIRDEMRKIEIKSAALSTEEHTARADQFRARLQQASELKAAATAELDQVSLSLKRVDKSKMEKYGLAGKTMEQLNRVRAGLKLVDTTAASYLSPEELEKKISSLKEKIINVPFTTADVERAQTRLAAAELELYGARSSLTSPPPSPEGRAIIRAIEERITAEQIAIETARREDETKQKEAEAAQREVDQMNAAAHNEWLAEYKKYQDDVKQINNDYNLLIAKIETAEEERARLEEERKRALEEDEKRKIYKWLFIEGCEGCQNNKSITHYFVEAPLISPRPDLLTIQRPRPLPLPAPPRLPTAPTQPTPRARPPPFYPRRIDTTQLDKMRRDLQLKSAALNTIEALAENIKFFDQYRDSDRTNAETRSQIEQARAALENIELHDLFAAIDSQIAGAAQMSTLRAKIIAAEQEIMTAALAIKESETIAAANQSKRSEYERTLTQARAILDTYEISQYYIDCMNIKSGIPGIMLKNYLDLLIRDVNQILSIADCGFTVSSHEDDGVEVYIDDPIRNTRVPIEMGSGFQKFIISIALRVSMFILFPRPVGNFFIIDEGFSCADETNISKLYNFLGQIKNKFDFMIIITHLEALKPIIEAPITISFDAVAHLAHIESRSR